VPPLVRRAGDQRGDRTSERGFMSGGTKWLRSVAAVVLVFALLCVAVGGAIMGGQGSVGDTRKVGFLPVTEGPPTVANRPVAARWEASVGGAEFSGAFERNDRGDTRNEIGTVGGSVVAATLWSAQGRIRKSLFYVNRSIRTSGAPQRDLTSGWTFFIFDAIWSNEYQMMLGQRARKIILMEKEGPSEAGYCWISEDLGLVLREELRVAGQAMAWRITELEQKEPAQDVLRIPPGFTETRPGDNK
jgi:hypothetical protein